MDAEAAGTLCNGGTTKRLESGDAKPLMGYSAGGGGGIAGGLAGTGTGVYQGGGADWVWCAWCLVKVAYLCYVGRLSVLCRSLEARVETDGRRGCGFVEGWWASWLTEAKGECRGLGCGRCEYR